jgi:hypothetical protein
MPIKAVARLLGVSKNTVKAALASSGPARYIRAPRGSIVDVVELGCTSCSECGRTCRRW